VEVFHLLLGSRYGLVSDALFDEVAGMICALIQIHLPAISRSLLLSFELRRNRIPTKAGDFFRLFRKNPKRSLVRHWLYHPRLISRSECHITLFDLFRHGEENRLTCFCRLDVYDSKMPCVWKEQPCTSPASCRYWPLRCM